VIVHLEFSEMWAVLWFAVIVFGLLVKYYIDKAYTEKEA